MPQKTISQVLLEKFSDAKYPCTKRLTNNTPQPLSLPGHSVNYIAANTAEEAANTAVVTFTDIGQVIRFASDVEALAKINKWTSPVSISEPAVEQSPADLAEKQEVAVTSSESNSSDDGGATTEPQAEPPVPLAPATKKATK